MHECLLLVASLFAPQSHESVAGVPIPGSIDFESETPGQLPITYGPGVRAVGAATVSVAVAPNGFTSQAIQMTVSDSSSYAGANYSFTPVSTGGLRIEASLAFDSLINAMLFIGRTGSTQVFRLSAGTSGTLSGGYGSLGSYVPNVPVRVRCDVDLDREEWALTVDDEGNGFGDDPVFAGLPWVNRPCVVPDIDSIDLFFRSFSGTGSLAVDDVTLTPLATAPILASVAFRNGGTNPASYVAQPPVLGQTWTATVDVGSTGHTVATIWGSSNPTTIANFGPTPGTYLLFQNLNCYRLRSGYSLGPVASFSIAIPNDPVLIGATVYTQAAHLQGTTPWLLSNAQDLTIGN